MQNDLSSKRGREDSSHSLANKNWSGLSAVSRHCISPPLPHTKNIVPAGCHDMLHICN